MTARKSARRKKGQQDEIDLSKITILNARDDLEEYDPAIQPVDLDAEDEQPGEAQSAGEAAGEIEHDFATLKAIVEALLFVTPEPLSAARLSRAIGGTSAAEVRQAVKALRAEYDELGRAWELVELAGGMQLMTRAEFEPYLRRFKKQRDSHRLSPAALEALAIIAYRQPINRAEIENLRGVGCGPILRSLMEKRLVKIVGRSDQLGRPVLYGTTVEFLEHFGLQNLADLPRSVEFKAS